MSPPSRSALRCSVVDDEREVKLAETFGEVARALLAEKGAHATLQKIVALAVQTIDNCDRAGVSVIAGPEVTFPSSTECGPAALDAIQSLDAGSGIQSVLSFPLFAEQDTMGALDLYSHAAGAFDDHDVAIGAVFATHAAVALNNARQVESLESGMKSRQLIGQAVGILMVRQDVDEEKAFDMLVRASKRLNMKLRQVAEGVVHPPPRPPTVQC